MVFTNLYFVKPHTMTLEDLGYNPALEKHRIEHNLDGLSIGRVILEHKERYIIQNHEHEFEAEVIGNIRFTAKNRYDFPAVGDWVAFMKYENNKGLIHAIFPRTNILERQAVGKYGEKQIIAANIDVGLIIQAVEYDFNINRLERYLTLCYNSDIEPVVVLNKIDLIASEELGPLVQKVQNRLKKVTVIALSNETKAGYPDLEKLIRKGKTYCLLGSSGVGKSTLINNLSGTQLKTDTISESTHKGKHVTTHRHLVVLPGGGILIDNPGMREVGVADAGDGIELTFDRIMEAAKHCKYQDCTHTNETGCRIIELVNQGELASEAYENFLKMEREKTRFELSEADKRKKDKNFGKMMKHFKNDIQQLNPKHKDSFKK